MIIRKAHPEDAAGIVRVHIAAWQTTYHGIVPADYLEMLPMQAEERQERWERTLRDKAIFNFVAEDEEHGKIAGFINGGPRMHDDPAYPGELYSVYILAEYQKLGLGKQLVQTLAGAMYKAGYSSLWLWALDENINAISFYKKLGARKYKSNIFELHGAKIPESALVWDDISVLIGEV